MRRPNLVAALLFVACSRTTLDELEPYPYQPVTGGATNGGTTSGGTTSGGTTSGGTTSGGTGPSTGGAVTGGVGAGGSFGGVASGGVSGSGLAGIGAFGGMTPPAYALVGAPLVFNPTATGFSLNLVLASGSPGTVRASVRAVEGGPWMNAGTSEYPIGDVVEWTFDSLAPGKTYEYRVIANDGTSEFVLATGRATTQRPPGQEFTFSLITDSHIPPRSYVPLDLGTQDTQESTLLAVAEELAGDSPDFMVNLGDMLDFHMFGFNDPPPDSSWTRFAYLNYRRLFGETLAVAPHFAVIGNWDGENGCNGETAIDRSRSQRLLYLPGPRPDTYPQGGSANEDYYAFTWGDALFVVLNVQTYTSGCHYLSTNPGVADDWTLGERQLAWLRQTLQNATSKWRFLLIHHAVGGKGGDPANSAYGRGGGQAARVGEQAVVHDMMLEFGVQIFFYGHDHVFTDMVVDGIHYTLPGSAGAPWKFTTFETGYETYWPDSGRARVRVSPTSVNVDFVAMGGTPLFNYEITK
jgi:hypothetical protein